jgi:hypothetical protein
MHTSRLLALSLCLATLGASCSSTRPAATQDEVMQRWTEFMTPGAGHAHLAPHVGNWSLLVRMIASPGAEAQESKGTSTVQWILDGRYIQDTTTGEFQGQPFHGQGLTGFDNLKNVYTSTWVDNLGTGILVSEGTYDEATRTFHYASSMPDLMYANAYVPSRSTERWIDGDHFVVQSFTPGADGKEFMSMELQYSRAR